MPRHLKLAIVVFVLAAFASVRPSTLSAAPLRTECTDENAADQCLLDWEDEEEYCTNNWWGSGLQWCRCLNDVSLSQCMVIAGCEGWVWQSPSAC